MRDVTGSDHYCWLGVTTCSLGSMAIGIALGNPLFAAHELALRLTAATMMGAAVILVLIATTLGRGR